MAVIAAGRIVATGTPATLGGRNRMAATIRFTLPDVTHPGDLPWRRFLRHTGCLFR
jgi:ABC-2 type transport system ATP-binding protein